MELKEIEEIKQILIKELGQDNCNYLQYNGRLTHLVGLVQSYGQSQYNAALEKAAEGCREGEFFTYIIKDNILKLKIPTK